MPPQPHLVTRYDSKVVLLLILSISMISSASILIRFSTSHPLTIVFWRTFFGGMIMGAAGFFRNDHKKYSDEILHTNWKWLLLIGVILSFHFSTWFTSLFLTTVAASVVLVNTSPILTALLSPFLLGESLRRRSWLGVLIAVFGAFILAWSDLLTSGFGALTGDLLALLSAFFLALYFIGGRRFATGLPITVYTTVVYFTAAAVTMGICLSFGINLLVFDFREIAIFLALAIFPTALGHSVNNYLLTLVPAYVISSAVLGEPIGATLLAIVLLGEVPSVFTIGGFLVTLFGIGIVLVDLAARERSKTLSLDDTKWS